MKQQFRHAMLPPETHDELARDGFLVSLKALLTSDILQGNRTIYDGRVKPAFERAHKRAPQNRHEVRRVMNADPYHQMYTSMMRTHQEMLWDAMGETVERQRSSLIAKAAKPGGAGGSVRVDPGLEIPRYHSAVDIHCMPGAYHTEWGEGDISAGASYDRGVYLYTMGKLGPENDFMGRSFVTYLRDRVPDFAPQRILDMGCTVGGSTLPLVDAYPEAEVHGIDIGAPLMRYAHARAEALGRRVHFSQQNAEATDFEDGSFDLVFSCLMLHETSGSAMAHIFKECHRLLAPGGLMLHAEAPRYAGQDPYDANAHAWITYTINEPFLGAMHDTDLGELSVASGFRPESVIEDAMPDPDAPGGKQGFSAGFALRSIGWTLFGAQK